MNANIMTIKTTQESRMGIISCVVFLTISVIHSFHNINNNNNHECWLT